ncbi:type IV secretion system DNA-binding domain-containing protein [Candidatus Uhrbacteria bacterium]|nr:type IV secretion system DNA-binding domain-containing protein [Candidatus Uhrbacteria bacterium]
MMFLNSLLENPIVIAVLASIGGFLVLWIALLVIRFFLRRTYRLPIAFQLKIFLVTVPKEAAKGKQEEEQRGIVTIEQIRERLGAAESLFSNIGGMTPEHGFKAWFFGREDHVSFEIVAAHGLISFYVAVPPKLERDMQEQIHAQYPQAQIDPVDDYNMFAAQGTTVADLLRTERSFIFPFRTYRRIESDTLNALTNALAKVSEGDGAAIQYVVRPAHEDWHHVGREVAAEMQQGKKIGEALGRVFRSPLGAVTALLHKIGKAARGADPAKKEELYKLSPLEEEMVKGIEEKSSKAGLQVNIRIIVSSRNHEHAEQQLENIANAFNQFSWYEYGNEFSELHEHRYNWSWRDFWNFSKTRWITEDFIYRHFDERHAILLNTEEMASLFHFPLPTTETPNIRWLMAKKAPPPVNMPKNGIALGKCTYRGDDVLVRIKREDRRRHVYIIGKSGSGKSVLLANMVKQDIANGDGVCVIDPHGDFADDVLSSVPKERAEDVIYFDPSDAERPMGLNMLEAETEQEKDFATQEMIAIFYKLVTDPSMIGPMFEHYMRNAMLTLMADPKNGNTIVEIPRILTDKEFQRHQLRAVDDPIIRAFWEKELPQTSGQTKGEMLPYLVSKIGRFIENQLMRNIIGQPKSGFNFRQIMDEKKILIANLAKGKIGEMNSNLLGLILVSKLQMAAMRRADLAEEKRHDFYLYIDEFQNFITKSIATILSEARKYRLDMTIAHQYMGQLVQDGKNTEIRDAVLGNAGTMLSFRIGVEDAEVLAKEYAPVFTAYDLVNVERFTAYVKLLIDNTAAPPFNMGTIPFHRDDVDLMEKIKQLSRLKFGRDRRIVEAEILERSQLGGDETELPTVERTL